MCILCICTFFLNTIHWLVLAKVCIALDVFCRTVQSAGSGVCAESAPLGSSLHIKTIKVRMFRVRARHKMVKTQMALKTRRIMTVLCILWRRGKTRTRGLQDSHKALFYQQPTFFIRGVLTGSSLAAAVNLKISNLD